MGRTVPTFRNVIEIFYCEWNEFKRELGFIDRVAFEDLINYARRHGTAGANMVNPNPFEPIVMSILVEHEKMLMKLDDYVKRRNF